MTPETLRETLKKWLSSKLRIDQWGLNEPESVRDFSSPPSAGLDQQISSYAIEEQQGFGHDSNFILTASLPFQIKYRFDNSYQYTQIPRGKAETILGMLLTEAKSSPCIDPDIIEIDPTGNISLNEIAKSDWILAFELDFKVRFNCESREFLNLDLGVFKP